VVYTFCPRCATALEDFAEGAQVRRRCPACGFVFYHNPVPAAGGAICRGDALLLVRRAVEPRKGYWSLPAGFMEYNESARGCAEREIGEETGLMARAGDVLGVYSGFDDPRQHAVLIVFWMNEVELRDPTAGDDADDLAFFSPGRIPENIAFRAHREALRDIFAHPRFAH
jgi:ADP-ribose pyrophosphatase YjhB (NUDIX family)